MAASGLVSAPAAGEITVDVESLGGLPSVGGLEGGRMSELPKGGTQ